jgi:hypothetical protein
LRWVAGNFNVDTEENFMEKEVQFSGMAAIGVGLLLIIGIAIRFFTLADSTDATLAQKVRGELWSTYSGHHIGPEINRIQEEEDFDSVGDLLENASPDAITIEKISRSEPLMSWSSNQEVIVRVHYRFPGDTETQIEYMLFEHGMILNSWSYRHDTSAIAFYLNFF